MKIILFQIHVANFGAKQYKSEQNPFVPVLHTRVVHNESEYTCICQCFYDNLCRACAGPFLVREEKSRSLTPGCSTYSKKTKQNTKCQNTEETRTDTQKRQGTQNHTVNIKHKRQHINQ